MRTFDDILKTIVAAQLVKKIDATDKKSIMDFYVKPIRDGEIDIEQYLKKDDSVSRETMQGEVIYALKEHFGLEMICTHCYSDDFEVIDFIRRQTMPSSMVCECRECGERFGYAVKR